MAFLDPYMQYASHSQGNPVYGQPSPKEYRMANLWFRLLRAGIGADADEDPSSSASSPPTTPRRSSLSLLGSSLSQSAIGSSSTMRGQRTPPRQASQSSGDGESSSSGLRRRSLANTLLFLRKESPQRTPRSISPKPRSSLPHSAQGESAFMSASKSVPCIYYNLVAHLCVPSTGETLLHRACKVNHLEAATFLVEVMGAPAEQKDREGRTPVMLAAEHGSLAVLRYLQNRGCDMFVRNVRGNTVLSEAVVRGHYHLAEYLINTCQADVSLANKLKIRPVHLAVECKVRSSAVPLLELLHRNGADLDEADTMGRTPAHIAAAADNWEALSYLVKMNAVMDAEDLHGRTPFDYARSSEAKAAIRSCPSVDRDMSKSPEPDDAIQGPDDLPRPRRHSVFSYQGLRRYFIRGATAGSSPERSPGRERSTSISTGMSVAPRRGSSGEPATRAVKHTPPPLYPPPQPAMLSHSKSNDPAPRTANNRGGMFVYDGFMFPTSEFSTYTTQTQRQSPTMAGEGSGTKRYGVPRPTGTPTSFGPRHGPAVRRVESADGLRHRVESSPPHEAVQGDYYRARVTPTRTTRQSQSVYLPQHSGHYARGFQTMYGDVLHGPAPSHSAAMAVADQFGLPSTSFLWQPILSDGAGVGTGTGPSQNVGGGPAQTPLQSSASNAPPTTPQRGDTGYLVPPRTPVGPVPEGEQATPSPSRDGGLSNVHRRRSTPVDLSVDEVSEAPSEDEAPVHDHEGGHFDDAQHEVGEVTALAKTALRIAGASTDDGGGDEDETVRCHQSIGVTVLPSSTNPTGPGRDSSHAGLRMHIAPHPLGLDANGHGHPSAAANLTPSAAAGAYHGDLDNSLLMPPRRDSEPGTCHSSTTRVSSSSQGSTPNESTLAAIASRSCGSGMPRELRLSAVSDDDEDDYSDVLDEDEGEEDFDDPDDDGLGHPPGEKPVHEIPHQSAVHMHTHHHTPSPHMPYAHDQPVDPAHRTGRFYSDDSLISSESCGDSNPLLKQQR